MRLTEVQIELTGVCNATCNYCTWQQRTKGKQHMDAGLARRLLQECQQLGVRLIRWHGLGESTLHPELPSLARTAHQAGIAHSLSTNCYTLRGPLADALAAIESLELILAIPWVMGEKFVERCVANAQAYLALPWQHHALHVQMVCEVSARPYYRRLVDTFLPLIEKQPKARLHLKQPVTWPNDTPNLGFVERELAGHSQVILDTRSTPRSIGLGCTMPDRFLMVLADGTYVPCCVGMDDWGLGNARELPLAEAWASARMQEIRRLWKAKDDRIPCGRCLKRQDCQTQ